MSPACGPDLLRQLTLARHEPPERADLRTAKRCPHPVITSAESAFGASSVGSLTLCDQLRSFESAVHKI